VRGGAQAHRCNKLSSASTSAPMLISPGSPELPPVLLQPHPSGWAPPPSGAVHSPFLLDVLVCLLESANGRPTHLHTQLQEVGAFGRRHNEHWGLKQGAPKAAERSPPAEETLVLARFYSQYPILMIIKSTITQQQREEEQHQEGEPLRLGEKLAQ